MPIIEGFGDEVVMAFGVLVSVILVFMAWISTRVYPISILYALVIERQDIPSFMHQHTPQSTTSLETESFLPSVNSTMSQLSFYNAPIISHSPEVTLPSISNSSIDNLPSGISTENNMLFDHEFSNIENSTEVDNFLENNTNNLSMQELNNEASSKKSISNSISNTNNTNLELNSNNSLENNNSNLEIKINCSNHESLKNSDYTLKQVNSEHLNSSSLNGFIDTSSVNLTTITNSINQLSSRQDSIKITKLEKNEYSSSLPNTNVGNVENGNHNENDFSNIINNEKNVLNLSKTNEQIDLKTITSNELSDSKQFDSSKINDLNNFGNNSQLKLIANNDDCISIKIQFVDGRQKIVQAKLDDTIREFKCNNFADELSQQCTVRFIVNGQELRNESSSLRAYKVENNSIIHCLVIPYRTINSHGVPNNESELGARNSQNFWGITLGRSFGQNTSSGLNRRIGNTSTETANNTINNPSAHMFNTVNNEGRVVIEMGTLMFPVFGLALGLLWYARIFYRGYFNGVSTFSLLAITFFYFISFIVSFRGVNNHGDNNSDINILNHQNVDGNNVNSNTIGQNSALLSEQANLNFQESHPRLD